VTFAFPDDANHVLKREPKPRAELVAADVLAGYNGPEAQMDSDATRLVVEWLLAHMGRG